MKKVLGRAFALVALSVIVFLVWFKSEFGGPTKPFPTMATPPVLTDPQTEIVATLDQAPGNIAVSAKGRVFFNYHPEGRPEGDKVVELVDGKPQAFPDPSWQQARGPNEPFFHSVFSLRIDRQDRLWTIDHGFHGLLQPRLLAFDINTRALVHQWDAPKSALPRFSYAQDFHVTPDGQHIFIADIGVMAKRPAIVHYDVATGKARRLLERHESLMDQPYKIVNRGREMSLLGGLYKMHPALDSIVIDRQGTWLYYSPMSHDRMFRIKVEDLLNGQLDDTQLAQKIEDYGPKPQSDGLSIDDAGNIYITAVEQSDISILTPDRKVQTLVADERFRWPDGLSFGPDGWVYIADSDIPSLMMQPTSTIKANAPYHIFRFQSGQTGQPGH